MTEDRRETRLRWLWPVGRIVLPVAVLGAVGYWFLFVPTAVVSRRVEEGEIVAEVMGTGTLDAHVKATISTKIPGRLGKIFVDEGDRVSAGREVARLDDRDLRHEVEIEEANVTAHQANVERLVADTAYAKSVLGLARNNHQRAQKLAVAKAVSQEEMDRAVEAFDTARAGLERAEAALVEGRKQLIAVEKTLDFRQARLDETVILAPFDGLIVRRDRDPGDVVVPGSSILALVSQAEIRVGAWVDESNMAKLETGQPARIVFRSDPDRAYLGKVVRLGRETDRETREFRVDVCPDELPDHWTIGQRAEVFIETARKTNVPLVPAGFIVWRDGSAGVFAAVDGRSAWRELKLGLRGRDAVEVVDGLAADAVVVRPAVETVPLADGRRIALP